MTVETITPEPSRKSVLAPLQLLRAIAASMVVVAHCQEYANRRFMEGAFANLGTLGVAIFFIISGFIMYYTCRSNWSGNPDTAKSFFMRRLHRIVPLYWLITTLTIMIFLVADRGELTLKHIAGSYFFIPYGFDGIKFRPLVGVGWTLDFEMFFYALFAGALLLPKRMGLPAILGALLALVIANVTGFHFAEPLAALTEPIILLFGLGIVVGWLRDRIEFRLGKWAYRLIPFLFLIAAPISLFLTDPTSKMVFLPLIWIVALGFVLHAVFAPEGHRTSDFGLKLGDASYLLYVLHPMVIKIFGVAALHVGLRSVPEKTAVAVLLFAASIVGAMIGHVQVEKRLAKWTAPLFRPKPQPTLHPAHQ